MKKLFVTFVTSFLLLIAACGIMITNAYAQVNYGASGASVQGREYWFDRAGDRVKFEKDIEQTTKNYSRFQACNLQKVYQQNRWQTCSSCGTIITSPFQELGFQTRCW